MSKKLFCPHEKNCPQLDSDALAIMQEVGGFPPSIYGGGMVDYYCMQDKGNNCAYITTLNYLKYIDYRTKHLK